MPAYFAITRLKLADHKTLPMKVNRWPVIWQIMFLLLVLIIGLRHEVGADWFNYIEHIGIHADATLEEKIRGKDLAYVLFNELALQTGFGVYLVNLLSASFFAWGLIVFCREQPRPWLSMVVAVPYLITAVAMGYTRQGGAIGVAMLAMVALGQGHILRFVLWIALAAIFHKSAVILVPLAIIANSKSRILTFLWVLISGGILFYLLLQEAVDYFILAYIEQEYQSAGALIRITMNALPGAIFIMFRKSFKLTAEEGAFWTWMAWVALLFIVLLKISPSSAAVDRIALYWIPLQLFVLSRLPNALGQAQGKNALWVFIIILYSATVHFVWLFFADTAFAWLPYQFYPWLWFIKLF